MNRKEEDRPTSLLSDLLQRLCPFCAKGLRNHSKIQRVTPKQLCSLLSSREKIVLFDVRHPLDTLGDPRTLPGATRVRPQDLAWSDIAIPKDRPVVLYCAMPKEAGSEHAAHILAHRGYSNVSVLEGGFYGWKQAGLPMVDYQLSEAERAQIQRTACESTVE